MLDIAKTALGSELTSMPLQLNPLPSQLLITKTVQTCHSITDWHAAVRPVIPDLRCDCKIRGWADSQFADKVNIRSVRANVCSHKVRQLQKR